jgi:hypothetical protein
MESHERQETKKIAQKVREAISIIGRRSGISVREHLAFGKNDNQVPIEVSDSYFGEEESSSHRGPRGVLILD